MPLHFVISVFNCYVSHVYLLLPYSDRTKDVYLALQKKKYKRRALKLNRET